MIDFSGLVLLPAMNAFGRPITVYPGVSQPGEPEYAARGIFTTKHVEVPTDEGDIISTQSHELGIRIAEYPVLPRQGDRVQIDAYKSLPRVGMCLIEDARHEDGQGGRTWSVKVLEP